MNLRGIQGSVPPLRGEPLDPTRRQSVKLTTLAGSGLTLALVLPGCSKPAGKVAGSAPSAGAAEPFATPFVHIAPDSTVTVLSKHLEAGQGVWTGLPAIVAEELDASWSQMRIESAPTEVLLYGNLSFEPKGRMQRTGAPTSLANSWIQLPHAGTTARAMPVQAPPR